MTTRRVVLWSFALQGLGVLPAVSAVKPGLEGGQELFRKNHWEEARTHLRSQWATLPAKDQPAATFLIGRSYVREAEFYGAVRRVGVEVGLAYLKELAATRANRGLALLPLFTGLYELEAGLSKEAERTLAAASAAPALGAEWKAVARLRRAVALHRLGRAAEAAAVLKEPGVEASFWRLVLTGTADASFAAPKGRKDRVLAAAVLFRASRAHEAEALLTGIDLDAPDAEAKPDAEKVLRFHDPALALAWERIGWERAVVTLKPLAVGGVGLEKSLAAYYAGLSYFRLGATAEAARYLKDPSASSLPPELQPTSRLLTAAIAWKDQAPPATELASLWELTQAQPESVLTWEDLSRADLLKTEPFATRLEPRLRDLLSASGERPGGALVGKWALVRLRHGDDAGTLVTTLSEHRDDSNKNKLEWNDPLLLLALVAANRQDQQYAQALETLFELSKTLPGLRWLQWNLQGVYAARQKAGGEIRISQ
jgi:hypothetical protein